LTRLGTVQSLVIAILRDGARSFEDVVRSLSMLSVPKSSIYTAIDELTRRGLVRKKSVGNEIVIELTEEGSRVVSTALTNLVRRIVESIILAKPLRDVVEEVVENLDPDTLRALEESLRMLLEIVEKHSKRWRRVAVE